MKNTIYVRIEKDGDESYLLANEKLEDLVEEGITRVGVYVLDRIEYYRRTVEQVAVPRRKS